MILRSIGQLADRPRPLTLEDVPAPSPRDGHVRIRVIACGVCHTELDEIEGRAPPSVLPRILGHQIVGVVDDVGPGVSSSLMGQRVGVAWIHHACGQCVFCQSGRENLCARFVATGRDVDGGYADMAVAPVDFIHEIPDALTDTDAAPLLCAGAIGYRSLMLAGISNGQPLGLTGFGASAHLVMAIAHAIYPASAIHVFVRSESERAFARELGAVWAGDTDDTAPEPLAAIIDTTPAWRPVLRALVNLAPAGRLVINAIRKEDADRGILAEINYADHLWREKSIQSVANVTRTDVRECLRLFGGLSRRPVVAVYPLEAANEALLSLKRGGIRGAHVLELA